MIDFDDPRTWNQPLSDTDAVSLGIWALNTLQHPDASTDPQFAALDAHGANATARLADLRDRLTREPAPTEPDG